MRSYTLRKRFYYSATRQSQARHEVVVITPENAFWVVSCDSICWDALINGRMHRLREFMTYPKTQLDGVTLLAQGFFFVLVANARTLSQILIVSAYIFLTFLHGILPPLAGNLNQIAFSPLYHYRACGAENSQAHQPQTEIQPSLARTVWYTIQLTGSACWIRPVRAIPDESGWNIWLDEARHQVSIKSSDWPAEGEKRRLVDKDENIYILPETPKPSVTIESVGLRLVPEEQW
ncbi:hypothetical protein QQS21_010869 [Conoideocrella luteorostrata]|uniref:Uncharacterized protein n=1 Tax=Conoideocrella luteorostrata TaxID=1105319 RepID=A0AAJ0CEB8_9HYPO|nr:hypothetical protein QQS21_010869 [Conoideocrella luteorostrata]